MERLPKSAFWSYIALIALSAIVDEARVALLIGCIASAIALLLGVLIPLPKVLSLPKPSEPDANAFDSVAFEVRATKDFFLGLCWFVSIVSVLTLMTPLPFERMFEWGFAPYVAIVMLEAYIVRVALTRILERRFLRHAALALGYSVQEGALEFRDPDGERRIALGSSSAKVEPVLYRKDDPNEAIPASALRFHQLSNLQIDKRSREEMAGRFNPLRSERSTIPHLANFLNFIQALLSLVAVASVFFALLTMLYQLAIFVIAISSLATFLGGVLHSPHSQRSRVLEVEMCVGRNPAQDAQILSGAEIPTNTSKIHLLIKTSNIPLLTALLLFPVLLVVADFAIAPSMFTPLTDEAFVLGIPLLGFALAGFWFSRRWFHEQFLIASGEIGLATRNFRRRRVWGDEFEYYFRDILGDHRGGHNLAHSGSERDTLAVVFYPVGAPDSSLCGDGMLFHRVFCTAETTAIQASAAAESL